MLPKLQIPYKNKLDDSHIKDKYVNDQNKLAS